MYSNKIQNTSKLFDQINNNQNFFLKLMRDCKLNSINLPRAEAPARKLRNEKINPYGIQNSKKIMTEFNQLLSKTTAKNFNNVDFVNRDSGRINTSPMVNKNKQMSHLEVLKTQARAQLQKLTLREKLTQIQHIFKIVKELCKAYGYFSVTQAMLQFTLEDEIKISVWIHPDSRSTKPLHPIRKQTEFQCELACVAELKSIVKSLFPTIELGNAKTFTNIIAYIDSLKNDWDNKSKKSPVMKRKDSANITEETNKKENKTMNNLVVSQKTMPTLDLQRTQQEQKEEDNRKRFKNDQKHKETTSTLLESMKSANSILEKIKTGVVITTTPLKPKLAEGNTVPERKKRNTSLNIETKQMVSIEKPQPLTPKNLIESKTEYIDEALAKARVSHHFGSQDKPNPSTNRLSMKQSMTGKRQMTMSIEIQSEINNLFGSNDDMLSNFYSKNPNLQAVKNSILSKVAQQFEDIF